MNNISPESLDKVKRHLDFFRKKGASLRLRLLLGGGGGVWFRNEALPASDISDAELGNAFRDLGATGVEFYEPPIGPALSLSVPETPCAVVRFDEPASLAGPTAYAPGPAAPPASPFHYDLELQRMQFFQEMELRRQEFDREKEMMALARQNSLTTQVQELLEHPVGAALGASVLKKLGLIDGEAAGALLGAATAAEEDTVSPNAQVQEMYTLLVSHFRDLAKNAQKFSEVYTILLALEQGGAQFHQNVLASAVQIVNGTGSAPNAAAPNL